MTFDELWQESVKQNPGLRTEAIVRLTVAGLKKAMRLAYNKGHATGMSVGLASNDVFNALINPKGKTT